MLRQWDVSPRTEKAAEFGAYLGMCLLQGATLPTTIPIILGYNPHLPPLSMVLMVWLGLILYFVRALVRFDKLYLISNGVGIVLNFILLIVIVFSG
jgi:hypothetical protein